MTQHFDTLDHLRLEIEQTPTGLVNLVPNPSGGDLDAWGWVTPSPNAVLYTYTFHGTPWLRYASANDAFNFLYPEYLPVAAGQYAAARWVQGYDTISHAYVAARIAFYDAAGTTTGGSDFTPFNPGGTVASGGTVYSIPAIQAPAGTVKARIFYAIAGDASGNIANGQEAYLREVTFAVAATAAALTGLGYLPTATYTDVLGSTHSITLTRGELNVGTLAAEIRDSTLDPAQSDLIAPGKRCRLMVLAEDTWAPIFTGKVTRGATAYNPTRDETRKVQITLTATDAITQLAQVIRTEGVGQIAELPWVLEGAGLPWNVNGSNAQIPSAAIVANSDNTSALDQITITRDSRSAYAWVDRRGVLQAWDRDTIATDDVATLDEHHYSALGLDYDTDRCINIVTVKLRSIDPATGDTIETPYGPYTETTSYNRWGPHAATFTIQGLDPAAVPAFAEQIFAANATPLTRVTSLTLPITDPADFADTDANAFLDIYDPVAVINGDTAWDLRITTVKHTITAGTNPGRARWLMALTFTAPTTVARPQAVPTL